MFEFFDKLEKKRAFKKALKEVNNSVASYPSRVFEEKTSSVNVQPRSVEPAYKSPIRNPLRKPETTYVDLKYFKDWRKVDKVKSDNPVYKSSPRPIFAEDNKPKAEIKVEPKKAESTAETIEKLSVIRKEENEKTISKDINDYILKDNSKDIHEMLKKVAPQSYSKAVNKPEPAPIPKKEPEKEPDRNIKVEVINFEKKQPNKPKTNRKPRGKSKRRFDADVITSVDWK